MKSTYTTIARLADALADSPTTLTAGMTYADILSRLDLYATLRDLDPHALDADDVDRLVTDLADGMVTR